MQNCLGELNLTYCLIYLDDIIVFLKTEEEHLHHLHALCSSTSENTTWSSSWQSVISSRVRLTIWLITSPRKCVWPSKENLKAMARIYSTLNLHWKFKAFLDLVGHYRQLLITGVSCAYCAIIAWTSIWGRFQQEEQISEHSQKRYWVPLRCLRRLVFETPVMAFADFNMSFLLETNVRQAGIGSCAITKTDWQSKQPSNIPKLNL